MSTCWRHTVSLGADSSLIPREPLGNPKGACLLRAFAIGLAPPQDKTFDRRLVGRGLRFALRRPPGPTRHAGLAAFWLHETRIGPARTVGWYLECPQVARPFQPFLLECGD